MLLPVIKQILDEGAQIVFVGGPEKTDQEALRIRGYFLVLQRVLEKQERYKGKLGFSLECSVKKARLSFTAADIGIVPSIYAPYEIVPVQSAAMGAVVVHANCGGMKDTMMPVREKEEGQIEGFAFGFNNAAPTQGKYSLLERLEWCYHYYLDNDFFSEDPDTVLYGQTLASLLEDKELDDILRASFGIEEGRGAARENQALIKAVFKVLNLYEREPEKFPNVCALRDAAMGALHLYRDKSKFRQAQVNAMRADFSWERSYYRYRDEMYGQAADKLPALTISIADERTPFDFLPVTRAAVFIENAV